MRSNRFIAIIVTLNILLLLPGSALAAFNPKTEPDPGEWIHSLYVWQQVDRQYIHSIVANQGEEMLRNSLVTQWQNLSCQLAGVYAAGSSACGGDTGVCVYSPAECASIQTLKLALNCRERLLEQIAVQQSPLRVCYPDLYSDYNLGFSFGDDKQLVNAGRIGDVRGTAYDVLKSLPPVHGSSGPSIYLLPWNYGSYQALSFSRRMGAGDEAIYLSASSQTAAETLAGVLTHEMGHYLADVIFPNNATGAARWKMIMACMSCDAAGLDQPDLEELFAEWFRYAFGSQQARTAFAFHGAGQEPDLSQQARFSRLVSAWLNSMSDDSQSVVSWHCTIDTGQVRLTLPLGIRPEQIGTIVTSRLNIDLWTEDDAAADLSMVICDMSSGREIGIWQLQKAGIPGVRGFYGKLPGPGHYAASICQGSNPAHGKVLAVFDIICVPE